MRRRSGSSSATRTVRRRESAASVACFSSESGASTRDEEVARAAGLGQRRARVGRRSAEDDREPVEIALAPQPPIRGVREVGGRAREHEGLGRAVEGDRDQLVAER